MAKSTKTATPVSAKRTQATPRKELGSGENKQQFDWEDLLGFIFLFGSLFMGVAIISHYFTWRADQLAEVATNSGGEIGLLVANLFVRDWFGIFAICLPVMGMIAAVKLLQNDKRNLLSLLKRIVLTMLLGSITLGFITGADGAFGSGLGGKMGIDVAEWLSKYLGRMGTALLICLCGFLLVYYINAMRTIATVRGVIRHTGALFRGRTNGEESEEEFRIEESEEELENVVSSPFEEPFEEVSIAAEQPSEEVEQSPFVDPEVAPEAATDKPEEPDAEVALEVIIPGEEEGDEVPLAVEPALAAVSATVVGATAAATAATATAETEGDIVPLESAGVGGQQRSFRSNRVTGSTELEVVDTDFGGMQGLPDEEPRCSQPSVDELSEEELGAVVEVDKVSPMATRDAGVSKPAPQSDEDLVEVGVGGVVVTDAEGTVTVVMGEHSDEEAGKIGTLYDPTKELEKFHRPPLEILEKYDADYEQDAEERAREIGENKKIITETLGSFGVAIKKITATVGPTVTLYELEPGDGVKVGRITGLEANIALSLKATSIRMICPMPGRGTVGIEIPNINRRTVSMYSVLKSKKFQESKYALPVAIGKTIQNETFVFDLADMPHMIVAGATGQGKSVGLNAIITSLIYKRHPAELKFVMVDPKMVELTLYNQLENHYLAKMESEEEAILTDTQKVVYTLNSLCIEMEERYKLLRAAGVKRIDAYNKKFLERRLHPKYGHRFMPYIVVVIDEFADMIMTAGKEVENPIQRLGQLARAVGIHLIIATQRPDAKVITGLISSNCPSRMAFKVANNINSRIILGEPGAEKLIGKGDMLVQINGESTRLQCALIDTPEIERIVSFVARQQGYSSAYLLPDYVPEDGGHNDPKEELGELDSMFEEIARFVVTNQQGSTSFVQRRFKIGYNRAGRIMDQLEAYGIVGRSEGGKSREVLISDPATLERKLNDIFVDNLQ